MLKWSEPEEIIKNFIVDNESNRMIILSINKITKQLFELYPTPYHWLDTPDDEKCIIKGNLNMTETDYIVYWMVDKQIWNWEDKYKENIIKYLRVVKRRPDRVVKQLAIHLSLLNNSEIESIIGLYKRISIYKLSLHCLLLGKAFRNFSNNDSIVPDCCNEKSRYTTKKLRDIRLKLGHTDEVSFRKSSSRNWEILKSHSDLGRCFKEYELFLKASQAKKDYLCTVGISFNYLLKFIEIKGLSDFSEFNSSLFIELTENIRENKELNIKKGKLSLMSVMGYIGKIKKIFLWGCGKNLFPNVLDFPESYWKALSRQGKKESRNNDGRAFSHDDLAEQIFKIIYNHNPSDEIQCLCKLFWIILASCPGRFSYIQSLSSEDALQLLPNCKETYGIYHRGADKAGNIYGQFPILDISGVDAIKELQERTSNLALTPIVNPDNKLKYVHLFQLQDSPWILPRYAIVDFFDNIVMSEVRLLYQENEEIKACAHAYRHHLLTYVACKTGDEEVVQTAAGHLSIKMTREYLRSKVSRNALLFRVMKKFEDNEITGKFYLRLVALLTSEETPVDKMLYALTTEMKLDEFMHTFGRKINMGYCFKNEVCSKWTKCWECNNFLITRNEISQAIIMLAQQIVHLKNIQRNCVDFDFDNLIVKNQIRLISLIVKRLTELKLSEEEIEKMVINCFENEEICKGVVENGAV